MHEYMFGFGSGMGGMGGMGPFGPGGFGDSFPDLPGMGGSPFGGPFGMGMGGMFGGGLGGGMRGMRRDDGPPLAARISRESLHDDSEEPIAEQEASGSGSAT